MDDDDQQEDLFRCAICGVSEGDSSNLTSQNTLQTNTTVRCGHQFCNSCIDREFSRKRDFPCPKCQTVVKKGTLSTKTLDAALCEKDLNWRRRVMNIFNKTQNEFNSLKEYNDYLEEVEDYIYCIVNEEPNAEECMAKMKAYEEANKAQIVLRQSHRADDLYTIQQRIDKERTETERRKREAQAMEKEIAIKKRKYKQEWTEFKLGEREVISAELERAQMQGYRNEIRRQALGAMGTTNFVTPKVREPKNGLSKEPKLDRELYVKRQKAGGGIPMGDLASNERNWNETKSSLFAIIGGRMGI